MIKKLKIRDIQSYLVAIHLLVYLFLTWYADNYIIFILLQLALVVCSAIVIKSCYNFYKFKLNLTDLIFIILYFYLTYSHTLFNIGWKNDSAFYIYLINVILIFVIMLFKEPRKNDNKYNGDSDR